MFLKHIYKEISIFKPVQDSNKNTEPINGDIFLPICYAASIDKYDYLPNKK